MRLIKKLVASATLFVTFNAAPAWADDSHHWVIVGHFTQDTGSITRLPQMGTLLFNKMREEGLDFGDRVTLIGTQGAPEEWYVDLTLSAIAGHASPEHLEAYLTTRMTDFAATNAPTDGSDLWWTLDRMPSTANCSTTPTTIVIVANGYSASFEDTNGDTAGAGIMPGRITGCHVRMLGLGQHVPAGATIKKRRELEQMFELSLKGGGAASYGLYD
ncbi:hypothetical protein [Sulfitobacter sp.]|uniref:hypothetical protein n=1 Tax=Sulfitobacter sp. TaxID=1903071 RepID=UPI003EFAC620